MIKRIFYKTCEYCGKYTNLFSSTHKKCLEEFEEEESKIHEVITEYFEYGKEQDINTKLISICNNNNISKSIRNQFSINICELIIDVFLKDLKTTKEEEEELELIISNINLTSDDDSYKNCRKKISQSKILREILRGNTINYYKENTSFFILQKGEKVIYLCTNIKLIQKQHADDAEHFLIDTGDFGITNMRIYFKGDNNAIKIKFNAIVSATPYNNGIKIQKNGLMKPHTFVMDDGLFVYKLIDILSKL